MVEHIVVPRMIKKMLGIKTAPKTINPKIKVIGANKQKPIEGRIIKEMMNETLYLIEKNHLTTVKSFICQLKNYEKGERSRFKRSISLKLVTPAKTFNASADSYHLSTALSWALRALEKEVFRFKEKFRVKQGRFKGRGRRAVSTKRQLNLARQRKLNALKARKERRRIGKVFPPKIKR